jgi:hypothetical protein
MLLSINKHTGAGTVVGSIGCNSNFAQGMDFNEVDNTCYMFAFNNDTFRGELRTCNTNDGSTILIGPLGSTTPGGLVQISGAGIAERFTLSPIYPGYQSSINFMNADVPTSLGKVFFIWGFAPGSTFIDRPLCNGSRLDIKFPQVVGRMIADIDQFAKLRFYIPLNPAFDKLVYTQALDADTCRVSNLNLNIIRNN